MADDDDNIVDLLEFFDYIYPDAMRQYSRGWEEAPFYNLSETAFKKRFRFSKIVVRDVILPIAAPDTVDRDLRGLPLSSLAKTLIALRFYATGTFQIVNGDLFQVSQPTVCRIIQSVSETINGHLGTYVKFPETAEGINQLKSKFYEAGGFPGVVGCIDGTHVWIKSPGRDKGEIFRNRKGWLSLNIQAVCGPDLEIQDIVIRWPGSAHDSRIFNDSSIKLRLEQDTHLGPRIRGILLGDAGYAQTEYVFTPVPDDHVMTIPERRYNRAQIGTRNHIERCFGVWKRMFPCLSKKLSTILPTSIRVIGACAVLRNVSIFYDSWEDDDDPDDVQVGRQQPDTDPVGTTARGRDIRNNFIQRFFS